MDLDRIRKSACVTPILFVDDLQASFVYYVDKLKFEKSWEWGDPASFGCVKFGEIELFFCEGCQGTPGTWLSIFIDDVDAYRQIISEAGADVVYGPIDEVWGVREIHVRDPDGHTIRFGTGKDKPVDEGS